MTEAGVESTLKGVFDSHEGLFTIRKGKWAMINPTQYEAEFIIIAKEGSFTQALISDIANLYTNNGGDLRPVNGGIDVKDFEFDFMVVQGTINVHQKD